MIEQAYEQLSQYEYMDDEQLDYFRQRLIEMRETLQARMTSAVDRRERLADEADQATQDESYWMSVHLKERDGKMLMDVEKAIRKLNTGDYGYCDETGEEIGLKRLIANPAAALSAEAMERRERIQKIHA
ncbi:MAG: TraR/DksA C4-type zinc finger protein [Gammaproteobacteria bacterium]|nr:TraR/DksA C4-type zinc finger protein [Gammaproteobacteria bacterium]